MWKKPEPVEPLENRPKLVFPICMKNLQQCGYDYKIKKTK